MRYSDWVSAILQNAIPLIFILFTYLELIAYRNIEVGEEITANYTAF
jgi:hypothetical protein